MSSTVTTDVYSISVYTYTHDGCCGDSGGGSGARPRRCEQRHEEIFFSSHIFQAYMKASAEIFLLVSSYFDEFFI